MSSFLNPSGLSAFPRCANPAAMTA
jgi:hypothetical protein